MKKFTEFLKEEVSTANISSTGAMAPIKPHGRAFGMDYFEVCKDDFEKCRKNPKKKFKHWKKLLNSSDIQQYAKQNKGSFLIKRAGYNDFLRAR